MRPTSKTIYFIISILFLGLGSCTESISGKEEFEGYLLNPENGLIKSKDINNFIIETKYMPPQYLALIEMGKTSLRSPEIFDSLSKVYTGYLTFLITISTSQNIGDKDVMSYNVFSDDDFKNRFLELSLNLGSYVSLETGNTQIYPVLSNFENTQDIIGKRTMYVVFADSLLNSNNLPEEISIKYNDVFFDTGISYFTYNTDDLTDVPEFIYRE